MLPCEFCFKKPNRSLIDDWKWPGSGAYADTRAVLVQGAGAAGDLRSDAAALLGYLAGRRALGAEELR